MKNHTTLSLLASCLAVVSLACWLVMFLAGTDVWHFAGSPDFWNLDGAPNADIRAFAIAFYAQLVALLASFLFSGRVFVSDLRSIAER